MVSQSRTTALGYGDLPLGGARLQEVKSLRVLGVTLESHLPFKNHLREAVSKAARSSGVVCRAGKLLGCLRELKNCFNAFVMSSLEYYVPVRSSHEYFLGGFAG